MYYNNVCDFKTSQSSKLGKYFNHLLYYRMAIQCQDDFSNITTGKQNDYSINMSLNMLSRQFITEQLYHYQVHITYTLCTTSAKNDY